MVSLTPEALKNYKKRVQMGVSNEQYQLSERRVKAWELANVAARMLKEKYGATKVSVFGSLVHQAAFTRWSDVDIAAWGIPVEQTFKAMADILNLGEEIPLQLVDVNTCSSSLLRVIQSQGVEI
jgi:predicted nucleotidyltransferase